MMFLSVLFRNKTFQSVIKNIGIGLLIVLAVIILPAYVAVPIWFMTHHIHHSSFSWYIIWASYVVAPIAIGFIIAAIVSDE